MIALVRLRRFTILAGSAAVLLGNAAVLGYFLTPLHLAGVPKSPDALVGILAALTIIDLIAFGAITAMGRRR